MINVVITKWSLSMAMILGALSLAAHPVHATVADGVYAYEKGNYQQARVEWLPYAALGNPNALYNLGQLSRMGRGIEKNYAKAKEYYLRAAEKGHVGAQRNLGTLYYFGRLGKVDYMNAHDWLLKAAVNGDARSQLMIGTIYYNGESGEKNNLKAYAWIMLASQNGLGNAASALEKLGGVMTAEEIAQAEKLVPAMISRQLSPDDVGLMIKQQDTNPQDIAEIKTPKPEQVEEKIDQISQATETTVPSSTMETADNFRVQLGSFRTEEGAETTLDNLKNKLSHIIADHQGNIEFADLGEKGIYYRLQLSPFENRSDADDLCSALKENGQNCYVVKTP